METPRWIRRPSHPPAQVSTESACSRNLQTTSILTCSWEWGNFQALLEFCIEDLGFCVCTRAFSCGPDSKKVNSRGRKETFFLPLPHLSCRNFDSIYEYCNNKKASCDLCQLAPRMYARTHIRSLARQIPPTPHPHYALIYAASTKALAQHVCFGDFSFCVRAHIHAACVRVTFPPRRLHTGLELRESPSALALSRVGSALISLPLPCKSAGRSRERVCWGLACQRVSSFSSTISFFSPKPLSCAILFFCRTANTSQALGAGVWRDPSYSQELLSSFRHRVLLGPGPTPCGIWSPPPLPFPPLRVLIILNLITSSRPSCSQEKSFLLCSIQSFQQI
ncbi:myoD family inhibitor isoform X1 [Zootoca vivipara]|uniref:myoD family inhibitor isoform X1 n=1 Tax=Zootoca vivipara TaxID=8524 RepID=UPI00158FADCA|nr:myoD family inhibitor isoform X1 [Zootoca vivipara]